MKKFAILRKNGTILVKTPKPYVVTTFKSHAKREESKGFLENMEHILSEDCKFLYDCLRVLKISKKEAIEKEYTLNLATGEALSDIARHRDDISHTIKMTIIGYKW
ncbi:MAG TPA: hypothetical protein VK172_10250 [Lentimicrobium sp.]|nr:hypothetical protein [Lentimicrobium sp.]